LVNVRTIRNDSRTHYHRGAAHCGLHHNLENKVNKETYTRWDGVYVAGHEVELTLRHDLDYTHAFYLEAGCVKEYITEDDMRALYRQLGAGLRLLKKVKG